MRITLRGSWPRMTQELANDRQTQARTRAEARMGVPQIVNSESRKARPLSDRAPRLIEIRAAEGIASVKRASVEPKWRVMWSARKEANASAASSGAVITTILTQDKCFGDPN